MEDDHYPPLPSNYVSVVDLQERWLQEQHRKQREKEEHQDRKKHQQHPHKQKSPNENGEHNTLSVTPRPFQINRGTRDRKPKLEESKIEALVVSHSQDEQKLKLREDKRKTSKHSKPRVEQNLTGGTSKLDESKIEALVVSHSQDEQKLNLREDKRKTSKHRKPRVEKNLTGGTSKLDESKIEALVVSHSQDEQNLKLREDKRKTSKHRKPRVEQNLTGGTSKLEESKIEALVVSHSQDEQKLKLRENKRKTSKHRKPRVEQNLTEGTSKLDESKIEALVVSHSQDEQKLKLREDKRKTSRHRKPRVEENLTGGTSKLAPVTNGENEQIISKFRRNDHKFWEPKVPVLDRTATLEELNFEKLSLHEGKACIRSAGEMNAVRRKYGGGSERVNNRRKISKQTDCNLVWVKKEDITGADITGIQSSGTLAKAGVDEQKKQQQPGYSKQKYSTPRG